MPLNVTEIMTAQHDKHKARLTGDNIRLLFAYLDGTEVKRRFRMVINGVKKPNSPHYTNLFLTPELEKGINGKIIYDSLITADSFENAFKIAKERVKALNLFSYGSLTVYEIPYKSRYKKPKGGD
jgi:hypothetical protein